MEVRFATYPKPAQLKYRQSSRLEFFPAQLPPERKPFGAPCDREKHLPLLQTAIHFRQLASTGLSERSALLCPWEWSGNRRQKNRAYPSDASQLLQVYLHQRPVALARQIVPLMGHELAGKTICSSS